jgi:hypothetical protein
VEGAVVMAGRWAVGAAVARAAGVIGAVAVRGVAAGGAACVCVGVVVSDARGPMPNAVPIRRARPRRGALRAGGAGGL